MGHQPRPSFQSPRFAQPATFMRLPHVEDARGLDVAIVGVPFDGGTSYRPGARLAPREIRSQSSLIRPYNYFQKVAPFDRLNVADVGDVDAAPVSIEKCYGQVADRIGAIADAGAKPIVIGGDHSITLPILRALGRERPLALVHLDAHLDSYDRMDSWFGVSDSAAHWASKAVHEGLVDPRHSIQLGMRGHLSPWTQSNVSDELGYLVLEKARCEEIGLDGVVAAIAERIGDRPIYVSFDLDCLDPSVAPAVSNLEPGEDGFTMTEASRILQGLRGRELVGGDVVCLMPTKDNPNGITAMNAAAVLFELAALAAESVAAAA